MHLIYGLTEGNSRAKVTHREIYYEVIGLVRVGNAFQRATVSNTFCSVHGTRCVGYRSKESEYRVGSSSRLWPALTMPNTSHGSIFTQIGTHIGKHPGVWYIPLCAPCDGSIRDPSTNHLGEIFGLSIRIIHNHQPFGTRKS
ncbi:hypothetical protein TNCV_3637011 [Trichonephila clavipes]|nr:hypothetical protein TNCV_3637011 [Trichonephila clavipes]